MTCLQKFVMLIIILCSHKIDYHKRVNCMFLLLASIVLIIPTIPEILPAGFAFSLCFGMLMLMGVCTAAASCSAIGFAGVLSEKYIAAIFLGNGISGIIVSFIRALCLYAFTKADGTSSFAGVLLFYILATLFLICAAPLYLLEKKSAFI